MYHLWKIDTSQFVPQLKPCSNVKLYKNNFRQLKFMFHNRINVSFIQIIFHNNKLCSTAKTMFFSWIGFRLLIVKRLVKLTMHQSQQPCSIVFIYFKIFNILFHSLTGIFNWKQHMLSLQEKKHTSQQQLSSTGNYSSVWKSELMFHNWIPCPTCRNHDHMKNKYLKLQIMI